MNIEKLRELVAEYQAACDMYYLHRKTKEAKIRYDGNYSYWQHWLGIYEKEMNAYYDALRITCDMVDVDITKLLAVEKSITRQEKKRKWNWWPGVYQLPDREESYIGAIGQTERFRWLP